MSSTVEVLPVLGMPEIRPGTALADLLVPALREADVRDGDVLCISTKIVSKALDLRVAPEQRDAAVQAASVRTVARRLHTRQVTSVVQIPSGPVMAAAGVDTSNAPDGPLLLPEDPDACARDLHADLTVSLGLRLAVVLTDTSSRVWRVGVGDIALGAAGLLSLQDLRGSTDASGRTLSVTVRNVADELAAAADLVKGKAEGVPVAIVRGVGHLVVGPAEQVPARALSRTGDEDWFRRPSLESVWQALGIPEADEPVARMSPEPADERIARALTVALLPRRPEGSGARAVLRGPRHVEVSPADGAAHHWAEAGALAERVRTALGAEAIAAPLPAVRIDLVAPTATATDTDASESTA